MTSHVRFTMQNTIPHIRPILHFHERDLARSLIPFSISLVKMGKESANLDNVNKVLAASAAFHFQKLETYEQGLAWISEKLGGRGRLPFPPSPFCVFPYHITTPISYFIPIFEEKRAEKGQNR